jgi:hypothetical protein
MFSCRRFNLQNRAQVRQAGQVRVPEGPSRRELADQGPFRQGQRHLNKLNKFAFLVGAATECWSSVLMFHCTAEITILVYVVVFSDPLLEQFQ